MRKGRFFYLLLVAMLVGVACKKQDSPYYLELTNNEKTFSWESDRVEAVIFNDTLIISAVQRNKSAVNVIVSNSEPGTYDIQVNKLQALVTFDQTGEKQPMSTYISAAGTLNILEKNTSRKTISGNFVVNTVNGMLSNPTTYEGEFTTRYKE